MNLLKRILYNLLGLHICEACGVAFIKTTGKTYVKWCPHSSDDELEHFCQRCSTQAQHDHNAFTNNPPQASTELSDQEIQVELDKLTERYPHIYGGMTVEYARQRMKEMKEANQ